ncbi:MAG: hemolysin family protein [bacterium]|nr:hemolysin family protein [bacterium]
MPEIENATTFANILIFSVFIILLFILRISYFLMLFSLNYIVKEYQHLFKINQNYLNNREKYALGNKFLTFLLILFYFIFSFIYLKNFDNLFIFISFSVILFFVIFLMEFILRNYIFINYLKFSRFIELAFRLNYISLYIGNFINNLIEPVIKLFSDDTVNISNKSYSDLIVSIYNPDLSDDQKEIIEKIISLNETLVKEIMVPRVELVALEANKTISEVISIVIKKGYSKYPVYEDTIDNVIGIVFIKDILRYLAYNQEHLRLRDIVKLPMLVPENKPINELLKIMQINRASVAVVVDEYGGTSGLVTIEDIFKEIFGPIKDEHDKEEEDIEIKKINDNQFIINPKIDIYTLQEILGINLESENYDYTTLSGFIYSRLGRIPKQDEIIAYKNLKIKILEIKKYKISKVLLTIEQED